MSLLPYMFDPVVPRGHRHNPFDEVDRYFDQVLDWVQPALTRAGQLVPANVPGSSIAYSKEGDMTFQCETTGFKPEEISVDVQGQHLVVKGEHNEEKEGEKVERHFQRVVRLPKHVDMKQISCELSGKGQLTVNVPKVVPVEQPSTKIPITYKK